MRSGGVFRIARIGGIDIKAHWSWGFVVLLVTWELGAGYFPSQMPGENPVLYWALGLVAALLLFVSVLLHELSHSFVARARGLPVRDIVLFIFGGVSNIEREPERASDEFLMAVVGPLTSLLLAAICFGLELLVTPPVHHVGAGVAAVLQYLAFINLLLGLFNLLPGFPLDGGRVLRAILWGATRNLQTATRIAGVVGQIVAYGFIFFGLYQTLALGDLSGLWTAFVGWFLLNAAQQTVAGTVIRETLRGITVGQVMEPAAQVAAPHMTLAQLLTYYILPYNLRAVPVADAGLLVGMVQLAHINDIPQEQWGTVTVGQVMLGPDRLPAVRPADALDRALHLLDESQVDELPVVDPAGRLVGIITRAHVLRWLQIRDQARLGRPVPPAAPP